jgi:hypothetical protein
VKKNLEEIDIKKLKVLRSYRQKMILAEKINEIITLINKYKLV